MLLEQRRQETQLRVTEQRTALRRDNKSIIDFVVCDDRSRVGGN